ncbi:hypothetical protein GCK32_008414 [Trichostrongylus colubriformis]|uniref:K Homology domain-containing protein n=1 Tax=Trichostrongylus colubriformis TaxID=6319 RepID=A0AAN8IMJ4_TRICO
MTDMSFECADEVMVMDHEKDCSGPPPKRERLQSVDSVSMRFLVTAAEAGALLGKKGERMKALTKENECAVRISDHTQEGSTDRVCFVQGPVANVIATVTSMIKTLSEVCSDRNELGNIILIDVLRRRCGALPNGNNFAATVIKECSRSSTSLTLEVPAKVIGAILGRQGQMLKDIENYSLCKIQLNKDTTADAKRKLRIEGSEEHLNFGKRVFDLGVDGAQCTRVCVVTAGQIASEAHLMTQYGHEESTFTNIATICALEADQSNQLNLIAVTAKGVRIYFSVLARSVANSSQQGQYLSQMTYKSLSQQEVRPQCLRVAHVRFSPGVAPTSIYRDTPQGVSIAYADQSICVMATANRQLVWALSDLYHPHKNVYCESMNDLQVAGNVWAITPVSEKALHYQPPEPGMIARVQPHAFYRQSIEMKQRLIICSNEGIHEFDYVTPRDALREALFNGGAEGRATVQLWQQFGATEVLVLALSVLTSDSAVDERIKEKAASMFYSFKDTPELVDVEQTRVLDSWSPGDSIAEWKHKMRSPLQASTPRFESYVPTQVSSPFSPTMNKPLASGGQGYAHSPSRRHDALYYYFSRLLVTSLSSEEMDWLANELRKLGQVMEKYNLLPKPDVTWNNTAVGKMSVQASSMERQSLVALRRLIECSAEVLSLWSSANSFDLRAISASMDPATLPTLAGRPFCHLACDGQHLNGDLIRTMIKKKCPRGIPKDLPTSVQSLRIEHFGINQ